MSQDRYEREIEEILEKAGETPPDKPWHGPDEAPRNRGRFRSPARGITVRHAGFSYQFALVAGVALIIVSALFHSGYILLAGVALLALGYFMFYRAPRASGGIARAPRMWRGRSIEPDDPPPERRR